MELRDAIQKYLEWKSTHTSKAPVIYRIHLERFRKLIKKRVGKITLDNVIHFYQVQKIKYSYANVRYSMTILKNFFKFCNAQRLSDLDPYLIRIPKNIPKPRIVATVGDVAKMCALCSELEFHSLRNRLIIEMLWSTGMRVSELCDLNISDIDTLKTFTTIQTKKNKSFGWIMWSTEAQRLLIKYIGVRICLNQKPPLFIDLRGRGRLTPRSVERIVKAIAMEAGLTKKITPHSFRHGKAHHMLSQGAGVKDIQVVLRHSEDNPQASWHYIRLDKREFVKVAERWL